VGNGDIGENVPALEFAGLVKRFGDNVAVDHVDLAVPAGSFFGLVGPNGAGKTTSLSTRSPPRPSAPSSSGSWPAAVR
jgi:ABC-2 type transport system ATP-binding protein